MFLCLDVLLLLLDVGPKISFDLGVSTMLGVSSGESLFTSMYSLSSLSTDDSLPSGLLTDDDDMDLSFVLGGFFSALLLVCCLGSTFHVDRHRRSRPSTPSLIRDAANFPFLLSLYCLFSVLELPLHVGCDPHTNLLSLV